MGEWNFGHEPPNTFDNETWTSGYDDDFYMQEGKLLRTYWSQTLCTSGYTVSSLVIMTEKN